MKVDLTVPLEVVAADLPEDTAELWYVEGPLKRRLAVIHLGAGWGASAQGSEPTVMELAKPAFLETATPSESEATSSKRAAANGEEVRL